MREEEVVRVDSRAGYASPKSGRMVEVLDDARNDGYDGRS
jgi:hypothetical protein